MEKLNQFFNQNRDIFDDKEMPRGHEKRFRQKLEKSKNRLGLRILYGAAASLICISLFSFLVKEFILKPKHIDESEHVIALSDISGKYQEVEMFYQEGIKEKISEFRHLECTIDEEQQHMINLELEQFDRNYLKLQADLSVNRNDERIINAMINNYQTKIMFLELVINQIKQNC
jgi:hypothetical protein